MRHILLSVGLVVALLGGGWAVSSATDEPDDRHSDRNDDDEVAQDDGEAQQAQEPSLPPPLPLVQGEYFEAFDLLQNRPLAHRISVFEQGHSFWVVGGSRDFVRYVQANHRRDWVLGAEIDPGDDDDNARPRPVAGVRGRTAELTMPADDRHARHLEMSVYNPATSKSDLRVALNGEWHDVGELPPGWSRQNVALARDIVRANNDLEFEFSNLGRVDGVLSGGAIEWLRLGPAPTEDDDELASVEEEADEANGEDELAPDAGNADAGDGDDVEIADQGEDEPPSEAQGAPSVAEQPPTPHDLVEGQGAVTLNAGQGLSWLVWLHDDAVVDLELEGAPGCGLSLAVTMETGQGGTETVIEEGRRLVDGRGETQRTSVDPGVDEEQVARIDLHAIDDDECEEITLTRARLARPGLTGKLPETIDPPKAVIFWVIDTLRADYLPIHFDTDVQAPNLARLAEEGVSFETAYVQGTESRASHASLFTGLYPERHGVMSGGTVSPQLPILPHFFQDAGYTTAMLSANGYASHLLNLDRGWNHYRNLIHEAVGLSAASIWNDGEAWIEGLDDEERFFLYLGTIDPHATYREHEDFIGLYEPEDYAGRFRRYLSGEALGEIKAGATAVSEREKERIINLYKNEISFNDHVFGQMRQRLEEMGLWEDTLIVVTSDHGEEFWEHGSVGHGHNVHQEMVHVPLIFHYPAGLPQGRVVRSGAEVVDVVPTVRALLGLEALSDRQGHNLLPTMYGAHGGYPAPAVATQYKLHYGMQIRHWKIYLRSGNIRLYDRQNDPVESDDIRQEHPLASRWLEDSVGWFRAYREDWDKSTWGVPNNLSSRFLELADH